MHEQHSVAGRLRVVLSNPSDGTILVDRWFPNLITTAGRDLLAQLMTGDKHVEDIVLQIGGYKRDKGSPLSPATVADTKLHKPLEPPLITWRGDLVHDGNPPRAIQAISAKLPAGTTSIIVHEAGLVLSLDDHEKVLYNHVVLSTPITKEPLLEMTLTWEVIF